MSRLAYLARYDDLMQSFLEKHNPPGAALAVAKAGRLVYARGFGYADRQRKEPVRPTSLFRIASLSKSITSAVDLLHSLPTPYCLLPPLTPTLRCRSPTRL